VKEFTRYSTGTVAWNRENSDTPAGACYMMVMVTVP